MGRRPKEEIVFPEPEPEPDPPSTRRRRRAQVETAAAASISLEQVITEAKMLRYADARSWRLGEEYLESGAVLGLSVKERWVTAVVRGTLPYTVTLGITTRGNLSYECSCPYHQDEGVFCKHCVAVGLAYLKAQTVEEIDVPAGSPIDRIRQHLEGCSKEQLITLLMAQSLENEPLRRHLLWLAKPDDDTPRPRLVFRPVA